MKRGSRRSREVEFPVGLAGDAAREDPSLDDA
jgi:hypothetical protein